MKPKKKAKSATRIDAQIIAGSKKQEWLVPILLLLPSLVLFIAFTGYPFVRTIFNSFAVTITGGEFIRWAGFANWKRTFLNPQLLSSLKNTFILAGLSLAMTFIPAMFLALLAAGRGKGSRFYQTLYALPMAFAAAPVAAIWIFIFRQDSGLLNQALGTDIAWIRDTKYALIAVAIASSWGRIARASLYLLVGFKNVSDEVIEAADIDGAGWWTKTFKIMIPLASPQIFYVLFLKVIESLKTFATIDLLTGGGPAGATTTLMYSIYERATGANQIEMACCEALILFVVIFVITRIQLKFEEKFVFYQ